MRFLFLTMTCATLMVSGCGRKVTRIAPDSQTDLSGRWNDTDSRLVADTIIADVISAGWYDRYTQDGSVPTVIVGSVRNNSHEHINVGTFVKDIERALLQSGKVEFIANKNERIQLREEKADQMAGNASDETMKMAGEETGADVMLIGTINTIADQEGPTRVMYYQIDMELIDIESNRKLWMGQKKIKKHIRRTRATF